ncbi:MAG TPA: hypothetical protein VJ246_00835 [Patescibacteria group bacterium]|nr:hypothetical protein [Patescibacteria group bacterium]
MKTTVAVACIMIGLIVYIQRHGFAFAASPTPTPTSAKVSTSSAKTATPSASQDPTVTQNIKDRIEKILDEKTESAKEQLRKRAYVGRVERVNTEFVTIKTLNGEQTIRLLPDMTMILSFPRLQAMQLQEMEIGGFVVVMGYLNQDDVLEARRILVAATPLFPPTKKVIVGTVSEITSTKIRVITRTQQEQLLSLSKKTTYEDLEGEAVKRTDIKVQNNVLIILRNVDESSDSASLIRILK